MRDLLEKIDIIINEKRNSKEEEEGKEASDFISGRSASEYDNKLLSLVKELPDNPSWKQINDQMDKALGLDSPGFSFDQEETNKQNFMKMLGAENGLAKILVPGGYVIDTKTGKKQSYHELKGTSKFKKILSAQNAKGMIPVEFQKNKEIMADLGKEKINHGIKSSMPTGSEPTGTTAKSGPLKKPGSEPTGTTAKSGPLKKPGSEPTGTAAKSEPNQKIKAELNLDNVQKMTADDKNINDLLAAYNNILKKYGTSIRESIVKEKDSKFQQRMKNLMANGTLVTPKSRENVEADLKMLRAIRTAVQKGFQAKTLSEKDPFIMKIVTDTDSYIDTVKKNANYKDEPFDPTGEYGPELRPTPDPETAVLQPVKPKNSKTDAQPGDREQGVQVTDKGAADSNGNGAQSISGQLATKQQPITPDNILLQTPEFIKVLNQLVGGPKATIVNLLKNQIPELNSSLTPPPVDANNLGSFNGKPISNNNPDPEIQRYYDTVNAASGGSKTGNTDVVGTQTQSTDFNDLLRLAGTQKLTEASMNISMTGNTSSEVRELMDILKNAGMDDAMPVKDLDMFKSTDEPAPCPHCAAMHGMDSPCGEAVEEEWDNSPDEQYQDDEYMMHDLSGGINRKKERAAQRVKDPAVAYESKFKSMLKSSLEEMYQKIKGQ